MLKLMQGQRRSFEQLDRGQLWCSCSSTRGDVRGSKLPDRRHLGYLVGETGGPDPQVCPIAGAGRGVLSALKASYQ